ncbi:MAG: hypothetical protein WD845_10610 [Pirellulales bacterium]
MMRCSTSLRRTRGARWFALTVVMWLVVAGAAMAAPKKAPEKEAAPTKSYVTSYLVVIIFLGAGLMAVLRPSTRSDTVSTRRHDDEE